MKVSEIITRLEEAGVSNARQEVWWLLSYALGIGTHEVFSRFQFSYDEIIKVDRIIKRRMSGEPMQYILGEADFYGRDFMVGPGVLIPRHDTETLIDAVKNIFAPDEPFTFLDWGTGSGCIAITILLEFPNSSADIFDTSYEAMTYAKMNIERYGLTERVNDYAKVDLLISNPPYIPMLEVDELDRQVRDFEPREALDGGYDGMEVYRELFFDVAPRRLKRDGVMILEVGSREQVKALDTFCDDFYIDGMFFDEGRFPRCLVFRRKHDEEEG